MSPNKGWKGIGRPSTNLVRQEYGLQMRTWLSHTLEYGG
jgi:hypothetical protein